MSFTADFYTRMAPSRVAAAIEFIKDPTARGRQYQAELVAEGRHVGLDATYPYSLGIAESLIEALLDVLAPKYGPDRFDCEWSVTHPYVEDD